MPIKPHRWRRLERVDGKLRLDELGRKELVRAPFVEKHETQYWTPAVDSIDVVATGLPPGETGTVRVQAYYYSGLVPVIEYVDLQASISYMAPQVTVLPVSLGNIPVVERAGSEKWTKVSVKCTRVFKRESGVFPLSGIEIPAINREEEWSVEFLAQRNDDSAEDPGAPITYTCVGRGTDERDLSDDIDINPYSDMHYEKLNGEAISQKQWWRMHKECSGGSISPITFKLVDGDPEYEPVDDPDFTSATR